MEKVCDKHKAKPALIYGKCIGCELEGLRKRVKELEAKLATTEQMWREEREKNLMGME